MSTLVSVLRDGPAAGLAAVGLNLIVGFGLVCISLVLGVAVSLLIGLPAITTLPSRAIRGRTNPRMPK